MRTKIHFCLAALGFYLAWVGAADAALNVESALVNGAATATVTPGATVSVYIQVTGSGIAPGWRATQWNFDGGSNACVNHDDFSTGTHDVTFDITAPETPGTYDLNLTARQFDGCSGLSDSISLVDAIVVCADDDTDGICDASDLCLGTPGGESVNGDGCSCSQLNCDDGDACTSDSCLDGVCSNDVADEDGDGVCDAYDSCLGTPDGESINGDGCSCSQLICDDNDACTADSCTDGVCSNAFEDADSDGVCDASDLCPGEDDTIDADSDGIPDGCDKCPNDPDNDLDADGVCGDVDVCHGFDDNLDADSDGTPDGCDDCPNDAVKTAPGVCGCGVSEDDADGDGVEDCIDNCPADPEKVDPGDCGCGEVDMDSDGDDTADCNDECPDDINKVVPGACGCGESDGDGDGNGIADCVDEAESNNNEGGNDNANGNDSGNENESPVPSPNPEACGVTCGPGMGTMMPLVGLCLVGMRRRHRVRRSR